MKEKSKSIYLRVTPQEKIKIEQIAKKCGLSLSEYLRKRAFGYLPQTVNTNAFYDFSRSLSLLLNQDLSPELEKSALALFDRMQKQFLTPQKEGVAEITKGLESDDL